MVNQISVASIVKRNDIESVSTSFAAFVNVHKAVGTEREGQQDMFMEW